MKGTVSVQLTEEEKKERLRLRQLEAAKTLHNLIRSTMAQCAECSSSGFSPDHLIRKLRQQEHEYSNLYLECFPTLKPGETLQKHEPQPASRFCPPQKRNYPL